jgi:hypothetical protein
VEAVKYIALLVIFSYQSDGLDHRISYRIAGYPDMVACERHSESLRAQLTTDDQIEIEQAYCFEGVR